MQQIKLEAGFSESAEQQRTLSSMVTLGCDAVDGGDGGFRVL